ncbi:DUF305 domain-containing protein [Wenxinia saemankumensis]|uniref:DUF305 domain-containing protein n=1 Tax=Wenxinia saemankumensis TaxID=1447782 RepID=A0A1M6AG28_9RHOB|nr:DUF305 domain-containing protein [Wenxinia saemankumensis]SHI35496.1 protein of unknown function [Wenxinia saemankumensis]
MSYWRFAAMIATSTIVMFGLMYLNTYEIEHVYWSETRAWMALLMGAVMAFIMLAFMLSMYSSRAVNAAIFAGSVLVFAGALWLVRSQVTVQDRSYMSAMIPHHSIAIMTSTRAEITDPRVRRLADDIIYAQDKEIAEMRWLTAELSTGAEAAAPIQGGASVELVPAEEALSTESLAGIDPEFLTGEEIDRVFPDGRACAFSYTVGSPPVLVTGEIDGAPAALLRISGDLVRLDGTADASGGTLTAGPLSAELRPTGDGDYTDLLMSAGETYGAGFRGHYGCPG